MEAINEEGAAMDIDEPVLRPVDAAVPVLRCSYPDDFHRALIKQMNLQQCLNNRSVCSTWSEMIQERCSKETSLKLFDSFLCLEQYCLLLRQRHQFDDPELGLKPANKGDDFVLGANLARDYPTFVKSCRINPKLNDEREKARAASRHIVKQFPQIEHLVICFEPNSRLDVPFLVEHYCNQLVSLALIVFNSRRNENQNYTTFFGQQAWQCFYQSNSLKFARLRSLHLHNMEQFDRQFIARVLPQLKRLSIDNNARWKTLRSILRLGLQLEELYIDHVYEIGRSPPQDPGLFDNLDDPELDMAIIFDHLRHQEVHEDEALLRRFLEEARDFEAGIPNVRPIYHDNDNDSLEEGRNANFQVVGDSVGNKLQKLIISEINEPTVAVEFVVTYLRHTLTCLKLGFGWRSEELRLRSLISELRKVTNLSELSLTMRGSIFNGVEALNLEHLENVKKVALGIFDHHIIVNPGELHRIIFQVFNEADRIWLDFVPPADTHQPPFDFIVNSVKRAAPKKVCAPPRNIEEAILKMLGHRADEYAEMVDSYSSEEDETDDDSASEPNIEEGKADTEAKAGPSSNAKLEMEEICDVELDDPLPDKEEGLLFGVPLLWLARSATEDCSLVFSSLADAVERADRLDTLITFSALLKRNIFHFTVDIPVKTMLQQLLNAMHCPVRDPPIYTELMRCFVLLLRAFWKQYPADMKWHAENYFKILRNRAVSAATIIDSEVKQLYRDTLDDLMKANLFNSLVEATRLALRHETRSMRIETARCLLRSFGHCQEWASILAVLQEFIRLNEGLSSDNVFSADTDALYQKGEEIIRFLMTLAPKAEVDATLQDDPPSTTCTEPMAWYSVRSLDRMWIPEGVSIPNGLLRDVARARN